MPGKGDMVQLLDSRGRLAAITWVEELFNYSMNGVYKIRDKGGFERLVTLVATSGERRRWRSIAQ